MAQGVLEEGGRMNDQPIDWNVVKSRILFVVFAVNEEDCCVAVFDRDIDEKMPVYSTTISKFYLATIINALELNKALMIGMMNLGDAHALIKRSELPNGFSWKEEKQK